MAQNTRNARSRGEGTIFQRASDNLWVGALQVSGKRTTVYGKTRSDVVSKLDELRKQAQIGRLIEPTKLTFDDFSAQWLDTVKSNLRPTTYDNYSMLLRKHILPSLGSLKLQAIKPLHLVQLYNECSKKGLSTRTVQLIHCVTHKVLKDAMRWRLISVNPADDVDSPRNEKKEKVIWTLKETEQFLSSCTGDRQYDNLWLFLLATGARIGECLALRWDDVDLENGTVRISKSAVHVGSQLIEGNPKTASGNRSVYLPSFAIMALQRQRTQQLESRLKSPNEWRETDRVFTTSNGTVPLRRNIRREFRATCKSARVKELTTHDLRHISATMAIFSGTDPRSLMKRLGHSNIQMTIGLYSHALTEADKNTADGLDRLLTKKEVNKQAQ